MRPTLRAMRDDDGRFVPGEPVVYYTEVKFRDIGRVTYVRAVIEWDDFVWAAMDYGNGRFWDGLRTVSAKIREGAEQCAHRRRLPMLQSLDG